MAGLNWLPDRRQYGQSPWDWTSKYWDHLPIQTATAIKSKGGIMANWIQNCQICNDGLCIRMEELKKTDLSERQAAEVMMDEALDLYPNPWMIKKLEQRYNRYLRHMKETIQMKNLWIYPHQNLRILLSFHTRWWSAQVVPLLMYTASIWKLRNHFCLWDSSHVWGRF